MAELLIMQDSYQTSEVLEYFIEEVFSLLDNANTSAAIKMVILELLSLHAGNFIHVSRLKQFLYKEKCDKLQACMVMVFDKWMRGDYIDDLALEGLEKFFTQKYGEKNGKVACQMPKKIHSGNRKKEMNESEGWN